MDIATLSTKSRNLGALLEPIAGQVYFSPECHANYQALGFAGSRGEQDGVAMPDRAAYFTSRGSVMGQVPGQVVTATFAVFNPAVVIPAVEQGWSLTDAATICDARDRGAIAQLERIIGTSPTGIERANEILLRAFMPLRVEGRALFAGLKGLQMPTTPIGKLWRLADALREYRGDSHIAAWISQGLDAVELCLLTDSFSGLPLRTYSATRGWRDTDFDPATESLIAKGLLDAKSGTYTEKGRELRELIEVRTDEQMRQAIEAIGNDFDELRGLLAPWGAAIKSAGGYPKMGPHDMALAAAKSARP
jgi:hypothetical protein